MYVTQQDTFMANFRQVLLRPMQFRCAELAVFLDRGSLKDLYSIFPMLIDNIFGPVSTDCWNLRNVTNSENPQLFDTLQHFLSPHGPVFRLIYTLLRDPLIKFNFSLNFLPSKVRENADPSTSHPFYMDLIQVDLQTNRTISLMLNPFDYYIFHFAYHLINPYHQLYQGLVGVPWNTVYYALCCDYIWHFLPTNPSQTIVPNLSFYHGKNPIYTLPSINKPARVSKLLRPNVFNSTSIQALEHHPRNEIWRSETIMTVFIDMWLCSDQVSSPSISFDNGFQMPYKQNFKMNNIPTGEYVRILRVLVKQLHAFSSSAKADDTHLGDLKKIVIPYLQGRMYMFLRHIIHRWPLDGSFRLVLELWLSFIQPWRYPGNDFLRPINIPEVNADVDDMNISTMKAVDREHVKFMAENLLTYTVLLQQLLPRFNRVELASPKLALILYRLTKVFGQPNLVSYLREIEAAAQQVTNSSPIHSYHLNHSHGLPPLSPTSKWSTNNKFGSDMSGNYSQLNLHNNTNVQESSVYGGSGGKWGNVVRQRILEYEGPSFCYKPMFVGPVADEVHELIWHIKNAQEVALSNIKQRLQEMKEHSRGFFGFLKSIFGSSESLQDEFTIEERNKVPLYLDHSLKLLLGIFETTEDTTYIQQRLSLQSMMSMTSESIGSECRNELLTPQRARERIKKIKYEGDPDLQPIQSYEVTVLVRLFYQLALKINTDFGSQLSNLYYTRTFLGGLSRQILCPPVTIHKFDKSSPGFSSRVSQDLPPRISFRYFANFRVIFYSILIALLSKLCGYSYFTPFYIIFCIWFLYICLKAICENEQVDINFSIPSDMSMDVDISSNDTF